MIEVLIVILISGVMYRIPRGGPDGHVWKSWIGFEPGSFLSALVWATCTSLGTLLAAGYAVTLTLPMFLLALVFFAGYLAIAEASGYGNSWSETHVNVRKLTIRGIPLLNPLMGFWYWLFWKVRPPRIFGHLLAGWTAWAELFNGLTTATGAYLFLKYALPLILL